MKMAFLLCWFLAVFVFVPGYAELDDVHRSNFIRNDILKISDRVRVPEDQQLLGNTDANHVLKDISRLADSLKHNIGDIFYKKKQKLDWWQTTIIYEIYPRSFKDSDGDGVGDLRGIIEKVPYLKDLGIGTVWLTPIYSSPGYDMGYDISDYKNIDETMGSMKDFEELKNRLKEHGIKLVLDFVPNHTSDEHEWFVKSVQKIEPYTNYYVWADAKYVNGTRQPPNNWDSIFGGPMWEWNEQRQQYYLHQFYVKQPDLNFRNPLVSEEIKNTLRFWMDKGVDGFRFDAASSLFEREDLKDAPINKETSEKERIGYTDCLEEIYDEIISWRAVLDEYKQKDGQTRLIVVESYLTTEQENKLYGNATNPGAHFPLSVFLIRLARLPAKSYADELSKYLSELPSIAWPNWSVGNHDISRRADRFGKELVDGVSMMQLLLPGTPTVYMADELGMTDTYVRQDQQIDRPLKDIYVRDATRTPFQWDSTAQAGFSNKTKTWLPVNPNYVTLNAEYQTNAARSHLKIFKQLVKLRQHEAFQYGDVEFYEVSPFVFAFSRSNHSMKYFFVVVNLGTEMENVNIHKFKGASSTMKVAVASFNAEQHAGDTVRSKSFSLRPNAALVLESKIHA